MLVVSTTAAPESDYEITSKTKDYPDPKGDAIAVRRITYFRGGKRVYERTFMNLKADGTFQEAHEFFVVNGKTVYSCDKSGELFLSRDGIKVTRFKPDKQGAPEQIMISGGTDEFIDLFERGSDGYFQPISGDRYKAAIHATKQAEDIMNGVIDTINKTPKEKP